MADYFDSLAQKFLSKSSLHECSIDELKSITTTYPYFAPAQFLLLKKLDKNSDDYRKQYGKAILYYHNPLEFEQLFHPEKWHTEIDFDVETEDEDLYEETGIANEIIEKEEKELNVETANTEELIRDEKENLFAEEKESTTEPEITIPAEEQQSINTEEEKVIEAENSEINSVEDKGEEFTETIEEDEEIEEEENEVELPPLPKIEIKNVTPDENALTFEPYHTVDYFASQGIKLSQDASENDKFGNQLKSFTEWLKTMKRLPANKPVENIDPNTEKKVENLASHSVEDPNIVTEAMAEVWIKQGNIEKAIEVYNKLSLSNPSKNAFFAAKIQNLKSRP